MWSESSVEKAPEDHVDTTFFFSLGSHLSHCLSLSLSGSPPLRPAETSCVYSEIERERKGEEERRAGVAGQGVGGTFVLRQNFSAWFLELKKRRARGSALPERDPQRSSGVSRSLFTLCCVWSLVHFFFLLPCLSLLLLLQS